jgi:hypothetical protein
VLEIVRRKALQRYYNRVKSQLTICSQSVFVLAPETIWKDKKLLLRLSLAVISSLRRKFFLDRIEISRELSKNNSLKITG